MTTNIYIDAIIGSDETGDGTIQKPYKTLQHFCLNKAIKINADYVIYLKKGIYEITNGTIFGVFTSGNIVIIGKDRDTEVIQKVGMYPNSNGGNKDFTLTIAKLKYNIIKSLSNANLNSYKWNWNFYNVLIEYMPDNAYSVMYPIGSKTVFRNCVKLTSSTSMFRTTEGIVEVYDSMGYFTSGYSTSQSNWDKSGNVIGSVDNYEEILKKGLYAWYTNKTLILHDDKYKKWIPHEPSVYGKLTPNMTSDTAPSGIVSASSSRTDWGNYPYMAFDGTKTSGSQLNNGWIAATPTNQWIAYEFPEPKIVDSYTLFGYSYDPLSYAKMNPTEWYFEGLKEDNSWVQLDHHSNIVWNTDLSNIIQKYKIQNTTAYKKYRLRAISAASGASEIRLGELELMGTIKQEIKSNWETVSNTLPTSTQFLEKGMDSSTLLSLTRKGTILNPMKMSDKSEILNGEQGKVFSANIDLKKYFDIISVRTEVKK